MNDFEAWADIELLKEGTIEDYGNDDIDCSGHGETEVTWQNLRGE